MDKNLATEIIKRYGIIIAISLVFFLSVVDIFFVSVSKPRVKQLGLVNIEKTCQSTGDELLGEVPKISDIKGQMIGSRAASKDCVIKEVPVCQSLSQNIWVLLLISYVGLLIFNLAYGIAKNSHIQWVWESIMTGLFIFGWFLFDNCAQNLWFPLYITKLGIAIYISYLYFYFRKKDMNNVADVDFS